MDNFTLNLEDMSFLPNLGGGFGLPFSATATGNATATTTATATSSFATAFGGSLTPNPDSNSKPVTPVAGPWTALGSATSTSTSPGMALQMETLADFNQLLSYPQKGNKEEEEEEMKGFGFSVKLPPPPTFSFGEAVASASRLGKVALTSSAAAAFSLGSLHDQKVQNPVPARVSSPMPVLKPLPTPTPATVTTTTTATAPTRFPFLPVPAKRESEAPLEPPPTKTTGMLFATDTDTSTSMEQDLENRPPLPLSEMDNLRLMAQKHGQIRQKMQESQQELEQKKQVVLMLEKEIATAEGSLTIAQHKLRTMNELHFHAKLRLEEKEKTFSDVLKELGETRWTTQQLMDKYSSLEMKYIDFQVEKAIHMDQITKMDEALEDPEEKKEVQKLKSQVKEYEGYKEKLAAGDLDLTAILSGETLVRLEARKNGIKDAFARREARVEGIYVEIDEKQEQIKKLEQSVLIKEKQNQAKLRLLQRELRDKQGTEAHLKQTAEYLDRQVDPALSSANQKQGGGGSVYFRSK